MAPEDNSVGKRIVEALKMQNGEGVGQTLQYSPELSDNGFEDDLENSNDTAQIFAADDSSFIQSSDQELEFDKNSDSSEISIDKAFAQSLNQNLGYSINEVPDDFEYPQNVAVLKQLVSKLPQGVSKQMGATIIKQTLEAVGISMSDVLDEARQVQNSLNEEARNCQTSIIDCRRQIGVLEAKSKQYQRQFVLLNDIINLFLHIN